MEVVSSIKNKDMINKLPVSFGILLGCEYSFYADKKFTLEEIKEIYLEYHSQRKIFILLNLIMHIEYAEKIKKFIDEFDGYNVYFIFQDLGIFNILLKKGIIDRGIYNPLTMITNYLDLKEYTSLGAYAVGMSNEITLEDVYLSSLKDSNIFYQGFGYHPMYQTYRKILSLYEEENNKTINKDNLFLQEKTRENDRAPIIENEFGSVIFRPGVISLVEELDKLKNIKILLIDGIKIDEETMIKVNNLFYSAINKIKPLDEIKEEFEKLNLVISNEFLYADSVYDPKEFE